MYEIRSARFVAAEILEKIIEPGDRVIDATMGNGHDTEKLCRLVGPEGLVYAFDIQHAAVETTRRRLAGAELENRACLFQMGHEHLAQQVHEPVKAVVFNLGWLPGGDHRVTTRTETTLAAAEQALSLLQELGVLVMCVYPGHQEGASELQALTAFFAALPPQRYNVLLHTFLNAGEGAPLCIVAQKQRGTPDREKAGADHA